MNTSVDWKSLVFTTDWMNRLDRMAIRRFGEGGLAEEAGSYVVERLSENDWAVLGSYKGQSKPETYLYTLSGNFIEEFSRKRFGRPRPPEWLKRQGNSWVQIWKLVCLERQNVESVIVRMVGNIRDERFVKTIVSTIKAKLPWCGENNKEIPVMETAWDEGVSTIDKIPDTATPDEILSKNRVTEILLMMSSILGEKNTHRALGIRNEIDLTKKIKLLKEKIQLTDEERLILKMVYQDGIKRKTVAQALGLQEHIPGRMIKRVLQRINDVFIDLGINLQDYHEDNT